MNATGPARGKTKASAVPHAQHGHPAPRDGLTIKYDVRGENLQAPAEATATRLGAGNVSGVVADVIHLGTGDMIDSGGIEASAQEELRTLGALGVVDR